VIMHTTEMMGASGVCEPQRLLRKRQMVLVEHQVQRPGKLRGSCAR
jgi:hypothetical protein